MAMNMDALLRIKADVQGENNIRRLGNSMQGLQGQAKNAAMGFNSLKGAVAGFGAAIAGSAVVAGLSAIVKKSIDAGDELFNLQAKTGIAANALIGIGNAAKLADVDLATVGKGITKLNVNLVKAAEGNADLAQKFKALGVSVKDSNGQVVPADKALKQIADRFADMPDGAQKAAAAVALFGKSGADLIPLLNEGAASMEKFTYKIGEDFAARSDLFNDTLTEFGIRTQGFGLELTDALLPALQSILEVFGELFKSETDWTDLFNVIKFGISGLAAVLLAMVKLVDEAVRLIGSFAKRAALAFKGDFAGATAEADRFGADFMKRFQANMGQFQRLFTDAPSPGTGRRTGGRELGLDTSSSDAKAASEAKRRAAEAKRAAAEQERLEDRRATLTQKAIGLQDQLRNSIADVVAAYEGVGASPTDQLFLKRNEEITENDRQIKALTLSVVELARDVNEAGGSLDVAPFRDLINRLSDANVALADQNYQQGLKDLLPSIADYDAKIAEVVRGKTELTELEKLNAQVNLLQLDILAATNPALAEQIRLLREKAAELDATTKKQEENSKSFGTQFKEAFKQAYDSATNLGANLASIATNGIDGLTNSIVEFAATGKAAFKEFAVSVLKDLSAMLLKFAIFKAIGALFPGLAGFANGGAFGGGISAPNLLDTRAANGMVAANGIKAFASGGIVDSPTLFKFASGGAMKNGLMGEAGPEGILPLKRGRDGKLGVISSGGASTTINVSVDATGSNVEGDADKGRQLGKVIAVAVQQEIIKQKRPGGLL
jgi:lambda family phage tail tape measure protein